MASDSNPALLQAALDNVQIPHQPLVLISDSATCSGLPLFRDSLRRTLSRNASVLLVSVLHPPSHLLPATYPPSTQIIDLTDCVPGFSNASEWTDISARIRAAYKTLGTGAQVYIDAADILAEDHGIAAVGKLIRGLLKHVRDGKAPSRLTLLLPSGSALYNQLLSPTFSATLVSLHPHHPSTVAHLSKQYLAPVAASHQFWQILENAKGRGTGDALAYAGEAPLGDWTDARTVKAGQGSGSISTLGGGGSSKAHGVIVQVLVRKAVGGTKGISRTLEGLAVPADLSTSTSTISGSTLAVVPLEDLVAISPFATGQQAPPPPAATAIGGAPMQPSGNTENSTASAHADLYLPFNLSLTDEQKRRRGEVPVPYAHEGEGVELGFDDEEDEDDEEI